MSHQNDQHQLLANKGAPQGKPATNCGKATYGAASPNGQFTSRRYQHRFSAHQQQQRAPTHQLDTVDGEGRIDGRSLDVDAPSSGKLSHTIAVNALVLPSAAPIPHTVPLPPTYAVIPAKQTVAATIATTCAGGITTTTNGGGASGVVDFGHRSASPSTLSTASSGAGGGGSGGAVVAQKVANVSDFLRMVADTTSAAVGGAGGNNAAHNQHRPHQKVHHRLADGVGTPLMCATENGSTVAVTQMVARSRPRGGSAAFAARKSEVTTSLQGATATTTSTNARRGAAPQPPFLPPPPLYPTGALPAGAPPQLPPPQPHPMMMGGGGVGGPQHIGCPPHIVGLGGPMVRVGPQHYGGHPHKKNSQQEQHAPAFPYGSPCFPPTAVMPPCPPYGAYPTPPHHHHHHPASFDGLFVGTTANAAAPRLINGEVGAAAVAYVNNQHAQPAKLVATTTNAALNASASITTTPSSGAYNGRHSPLTSSPSSCATSTTLISAMTTTAANTTATVSCLSSQISHQSPYMLARDGEEGERAAGGRPTMLPPPCIGLSDHPSVVPPQRQQQQQRSRRTDRGIGRTTNDRAADGKRAPAATSISSSSTANTITGKGARSLSPSDGASSTTGTAAICLTAYPFPFPRVAAVGSVMDDAAVSARDSSEEGWGYSGDSYGEGNAIAPEEAEDGAELCAPPASPTATETTNYIAIYKKVRTRVKGALTRAIHAKVKELGMQERQLQRSVRRRKGRALAAAANGGGRRNRLHQEEVDKSTVLDGSETDEGAEEPASDVVAAAAAGCPPVAIGAGAGVAAAGPYFCHKTGGGCHPCEGLQKGCVGKSANVSAATVAMGSSAAAAAAAFSFASSAISIILPLIDLSRTDLFIKRERPVRKFPSRRGKAFGRSAAAVAALSGATRISTDSSTSSDTDAHTATTAYDPAYCFVTNLLPILHHMLTSDIPRDSDVIVQLELLGKRSTAVSALAAAAVCGGNALSAQTSAPTATTIQISVEGLSLSNNDAMTELSMGGFLSQLAAEQDKYVLNVLLQQQKQQQQEEERRAAEMMMMSHDEVQATRSRCSRPRSSSCASTASTSSSASSGSHALLGSTVDVPTVCISLTGSVYGAAGGCTDVPPPPPPPPPPSSVVRTSSAGANMSTPKQQELLAAFGVTSVTATPLLPYASAILTPASAVFGGGNAGQPFADVATFASCQLGDTDGVAGAGRPSVAVGSAATTTSPSTGRVTGFGEGCRPLSPLTFIPFNSSFAGLHDVPQQQPSIISRTSSAGTSAASTTITTTVLSCRPIAATLVALDLFEMSNAVTDNVMLALRRVVKGIVGGRGGGSGKTGDSSASATSVGITRLKLGDNCGITSRGVALLLAGHEGYLNDEDEFADGVFAPSVDSLTSSVYPTSSSEDCNASNTDRRSSTATNHPSVGRWPSGLELIHFGGCKQIGDEGAVVLGRAMATAAGTTPTRGERKSVSIAAATIPAFNLHSLQLRGIKMTAVGIRALVDGIRLLTGECAGKGAMWSGGISSEPPSWSVAAATDEADQQQLHAQQSSTATVASPPSPSSSPFEFPLRELQVRENALGPSGIRALASFVRLCPQLRCLDVAGCSTAVQHEGNPPSANPIGNYSAATCAKMSKTSSPLIAPSSAAIAQPLSLVAAPAAIATTATLHINAFASLFNALADVCPLRELNMSQNVVGNGLLTMVGMKGVILAGGGVAAKPSMAVVALGRLLSSVPKTTADDCAAEASSDSSSLQSTSTPTLNILDASATHLTPTDVAHVFECIGRGSARYLHQEEEAPSVASCCTDGEASSAPHHHPTTPKLFIPAPSQLHHLALCENAVGIVADPTEEGGGHQHQLPTMPTMRLGGSGNSPRNTSPHHHHHSTQYPAVPHHQNDDATQQRSVGAAAIASALTSPLCRLQVLNMSKCGMGTADLVGVFDALTYGGNGGGDCGGKNSHPKTTASTNHCRGATAADQTAAVVSTNNSTSTTSANNHYADPAFRMQQLLQLSPFASEWGGDSSSGSAMSSSSSASSACGDDPNRSTLSSTDFSRLFDAVGVIGDMRSTANHIGGVVTANPIDDGIGMLPPTYPPHDHHHPHPIFFNTTLRHLSVANNHGGNGCAEALGHMLRTNTRLNKLEVQDNGIDSYACMSNAVVRSFEGYNTTLTSFRFGGQHRLRANNTDGSLRQRVNAAIARNVAAAHSGGNCSASHGDGNKGLSSSSPSQSRGSAGV